MTCGFLVICYIAVYTTVTLTERAVPPQVAVITALPFLLPETLPVLLTVAMLLSELLH